MVSRIAGHLQKLGHVRQWLTHPSLEGQHSRAARYVFPSLALQIDQLPTFGDNFSYILKPLTKANGSHAMCVDCGDASQTISWLEHIMTTTGEAEQQHQQGNEQETFVMSQLHIWNTHHHWDHCGQNEQLVKWAQTTLSGLDSTGISNTNGTVRVFAQDERVDEITDRVVPGDELQVTDRATCRVIATPGHTNGQCSFLISKTGATAVEGESDNNANDTGDMDQSPQLLFCGDTLFVGGCGRFFDGPAYTSAFETMQKLKQLDQDTLVFCAHEYTQQNLRFVQDMVNERQVVDWVSQPTVNYLADTVAEQRKDKQPTVPSTIGIESEINPFLMASTVDDFALVRDARDNF
eukprot:m.72726 g.72726  ORF g.72726 m.72726 type:complete len:350 (-) comp12342_c0_seq2:2899-3948(-)